MASASPHNKRGPAKVDELTEVQVITMRRLILAYLAAAAILTALSPGLAQPNEGDQTRFGGVQTLQVQDLRNPRTEAYPDGSGEEWRCLSSETALDVRRCWTDCRN
jgi:hypothetical protein